MTEHNGIVIQRGIDWIIFVVQDSSENVIRVEHEINHAQMANQLWYFFEYSETWL